MRSDGAPKNSRTHSVGMDVHRVRAALDYDLAESGSQASRSNRVLVVVLVVAVAAALAVMTTHATARAPARTEDSDPFFQPFAR